MLSLFSQDYNSIRNELISIARNKGLWKDFKEDSIATFLLELIAWLGQQLYYNLNEYLKENYIDTAERSESIYRIAKLLNYKINGAFPAWGTITFTLPISHSKDITINAGTLLKSIDGKYFTILNDILINAGETIATGTAVQGFYKEESIRANGEEWQIIKIEETNYYVADNTNSLGFEIISGFKPIRVWVNGEEWTQINSFIDATSNSKVFVIDYNERNAYIKFGNGDFGFIPPDGAEIKIKYFLTQGKDGNVNENSITTISGIITDSEGETINDILVTNQEAFVNGEDCDDPEEVRINAPAIFKTVYRGVTKEDIKTLIKNYSNVKDVEVYAEDDFDPPNFKFFNVVDILIILDNEVLGYELPTNEFLSNLDSYLKELIPLTIQRRYVNPTPVEIDVLINVKLKKNYSQSYSKTLIENAIKNYFNENIKVAQAIRHSDLTNTIDDLTPVDYVHVFLKRNKETTWAKEDIEVGKYEFPALGSVTVEFIT